MVLPDADPLQPRAATRRRRLPGRRVRPPLGQLPDAADRGDARGALLRRRAPGRGGHDLHGRRRGVALACRRVRLQPLGRPDRDRSLTTARPRRARRARRRQAGPRGLGSSPSRSEGGAAGGRSAGCARLPAPRGRSAAPIAARLRLERAADRGVALRVRVEQESRPVRRGALPATRCATATAPSATSGSSWRRGPHRSRVARRAPRRRAAARRSAAARRPGARAASTRPPGTRSGAPRRGRTRGGSSRAAAARRRGTRARPSRPARRRGKAGSRPVPDDRFPSGVEPVVRELDALPPRERQVPSPRSRADRARFAHAGARLLELVGEPANRERPHRHGVLADSLQQGPRSSLGSTSCMNRARSASRASRAGSASTRARRARSRISSSSEGGRSRPTSGRSTTSRSRRPRRGGRAHRPERLGQDDAPPADRRDHQADRRARCEPRGGSARSSSSAPASTSTSPAARTSS